MKYIKPYKLFELNIQEPNYDDYYKMITKGMFDSKCSQIIGMSDKNIQDIVGILKENGINKLKSSVWAELSSDDPKPYWRVFNSASGKVSKNFIYISCKDLRNKDTQIVIKEIPDEWFLVNVMKEFGSGYYLCDQLDAVILLLKHHKIIK